MLIVGIRLGALGASQAVRLYGRRIGGEFDEQQDQNWENAVEVPGQ